MTYRVYARRFRPQSFDEVVGQTHITTTLKNAISMDRLAHAYLFAGPRGTGKTSTARILAMALNCKNGPAPEPCGKCTSCSEIKSGTNFDLIEIDGASNRRIDDIRNLRENVKFRPTSGRFKIYIIDESHMLTEEAFNALLKTLEEPPAHIKIILATTHPHKIPPTIVSRCQRFDFRKISTKDIIAKLKSIVDKENLNIQEDALFEIAKISDGSLRDAEAILEQIGIFSDGRIRFEDITAVLGIVPQEVLFEVTESFIKKDSKNALLLVNRINDEGKDIAQFVLALTEHFRNLLVAKISNRDSLNNLIELSKENIDAIVRQAEILSLPDIFYIINVLLNTQELIRKHAHERIILEVAMVKLTQRESLIKLDEILNRLSDFTSQKEKPNPHTADLSDKPLQVKTIKETEKPKISDNLPQKDKADETHIKLEAVKGCWAQLIDILKDEKMSVATFLLEARPVEVKNGLLVIGLPDGFNFHRESLDRPENKKLIEEILAKLLGKNLNLEFTAFSKDVNTISETGQTEAEPLEETELEMPDKEELAEEPPAEKETQEDSIVKLTLKLFDGKIINKNKDSKKSAE